MQNERLFLLQNIATQSFFWFNKLNMLIWQKPTIFAESIEKSEGPPLENQPKPHDAKKKRILPLIIAILLVVFVVTLGVKISHYSGNLEKPVLTSVSYENTGKTNADGGYVVSFEAQKGQTYQILRKTGSLGFFQSLDEVVTAKGTTAKFQDKAIEKDKKYTYKVRAVTVKDNGTVKKHGKKSHKISTHPGVVEATVSAGNLSTEVTFQNVGADAYRIYRKFPGQKKYQLLREWELADQERDTAQLTFIDEYATTMTEAQKKTYLDGKYLAYLDPVVNGNRYRVVPVYFDKKTGKSSWGFFDTYGFYQMRKAVMSKVTLCDEDGTIKTAQLAERKPTYVTVTWQEVPNADGYLVQQGKNSKNFKTVVDTAMLKDQNEFNYREDTTGSNGAAASDEEVTTCKVDLPYKEKKPYYTVVAYFERDGERIYADYETEFSIENRDYSNISMLYIADSIAYGTPYTTRSTGYEYAFPFRVTQLTAIDSYNAGIPGATVADKSGVSARNYLKDELERLKEGETPTCYYLLNMKENHRALREFDIIVLEGGANDHTWDIDLGKPDTKDGETFYGAWNTIFDAIIDASKERIADGEKPIKVIMMDLFYSDKDNEQVTVPTSREDKKNMYGLTYKDYQKAVNNLCTIYSKEKSIEMYHFINDDYGFVTRENCAKTTVDNLHLTTSTASDVGTKFAYFLRDILDGKLS